MARYRGKDPVDLAWNKIRRRIVREVDTIFADKREEVLNSLLMAAFKEFSASLNKGEPLELAPGYEQFITSAIEAALDGATVGLVTVDGDAP